MKSGATRIEVVRRWSLSPSSTIARQTAAPPTTASAVARSRRYVRSRRRTTASAAVSRGGLVAGRGSAAASRLATRARLALRPTELGSKPGSSPLLVVPSVARLREDAARHYNGPFWPPGQTERPDRGHSGLQLEVRRRRSTSA